MFQYIFAAFLGILIPRLIYAFVKLKGEDRHVLIIASIIYSALIAIGAGIICAILFALGF